MENKVSILTPCYNGEKYINRYFDSLLNQTYKNFEIIFVDDGSTDKTSQIVHEYKQKFMKIGVELKYIFQKNGGQALAINNGLKSVSGEYLVWPDSDDYYEKDALEILANELDKNKDISYVKGNPVFRNESDLSLINIPKPKDKNKDNYFMDYLLCTENVCCFPGIIMIRFNDFKRANKGLDIYPSRGGQNWQLILPITYFFKGKYIDKNVYNYLVRDDSHSHSIKKTKDLINRTYTLQDILFNVLRKIDINSKDKKELMKIISKKYRKERINLIAKKVKHKLILLIRK
jgi:glycosyltransferase involved in cell wall biosynthesis